MIFTKNQSLIRKIAHLGCIDFQQMPHASSQVTAPWQMIQELKGSFWSHVVRTDFNCHSFGAQICVHWRSWWFIQPMQQNPLFFGGEFLDQETLKHIISQECSMHFPTPVAATASHAMAAIACNCVTHVTRSFDLGSSTGSFLVKLRSGVGL